MTGTRGGPPRVRRRGRQEVQCAGLDAYYLGRLRETAAFEQGTERELRHTVGARIWGEPGGFD